MSFIANKGASSFDQDYPVGTQQAVVQSLIILGTHKVSYNGGDPKEQKKVLVRFELPAHTYEHDGVTKVKTITKSYTVSTNESSHMYKLIGAALGRNLTAQEQEDGYDYRELVGKNLFVVIEQYQKRDGNNGFKIALEAPMPAAMPSVALSEQPVLFDLEPDAQGQIVLPVNVPKWVIEDITSSQEYQEWLTKQAKAATGAGLPMPTVTAAPAPVAVAPVAAPVPAPAVTAPPTPPVAATPPPVAVVAPSAPTGSVGGVDLSLLPPEMRAAVLEQVEQVRAGLTVGG